MSRPENVYRRYHNVELTDRMFSIAADIGIYFGEVLRSEHPDVKWSQLFDNEWWTTSAYYGRRADRDAAKCRVWCGSFAPSALRRDRLRQTDGSPRRSPLGCRAGEVWRRRES